MTDHLTPEQRHRNMAAIKGKDTKPEIIVRRFLWRRGYRYRLNHPRLPGKPDIVLRKYRTCIFVNGCFWHGHGLDLDGSSLSGANEAMVLEVASSDCCKIPKSNKEFWVRKMVRNKERDDAVKQKLASMGWHSITIWECQLKPNRKDETLASLDYLLNKILLQQFQVRPYEPLESDDPMMAAEQESYYGKSEN